MLTHFAFVDYGPKIGAAWIETEAGYSAEQLIADILSGEIMGKVRQVLAIDPDAGLCVDVTREIGQEVCAQIERAADTPEPHDATRGILAAIGIDADEHYDSLNAGRDRDAAFWRGHRRSFAPSRATHL
jgi:hypothetical protein